MRIIAPRPTAGGRSRGLAAWGTPGRNMTVLGASSSMAIPFSSLASPTEHLKHESRQEVT